MEYAEILPLQEQVNPLRDRMTDSIPFDIKLVKRERGIMELPGVLNHRVAEGAEDHRESPRHSAPSSILGREGAGKV